MRSRTSGQIVPRVDVVQLCRVDERCEGGPGFGAALTAGEQVILLSQAYRLDAAFDRIAVLSMRPSSMKRVRPSQWLRV